MPLYEYSCFACGNQVERYHSSLKASSNLMRCGDGAAERGEVKGCGGIMRKMPSVPVTQSFHAFETRNLAPDGRLLKVESRGQLNNYMRQFGVREARVNGMFGGDMRSSPLNPERPQKGSVKPRQQAERITVEEAKALNAQAERTTMGTRRGA
jgi:hypothetical protein